MRRPMRNYWLDGVMGLLALIVGLSALLLWVVLPQGYFAVRLFWLAVHRWAGLALSVAATVHVALHWRWLVHMTQRVLTRGIHLRGGQVPKDAVKVRTGCDA